MAELKLDELQKRSNEANDNFIHWDAEVTRLKGIKATSEEQSGGCKWKKHNSSTDSVSGIPPSRSFIYKSSSDSNSETCHSLCDAWFDANDALPKARAKSTMYKNMAAALESQINELKATLEAKANVGVLEETAQAIDSKQLERNVITIVLIVVVGVGLFFLIRLFLK